MKTRLFAIVLALVLCLSTSALAQTQVECRTFSWQNAELSAANKVLIVRESRDVGYALYDLDGQPITANTYRSISANSGLFEVTVEEGLNNTGVIDAAGRELVPMQYGDIQYVSDRWQLGVVLEPATEDNYDYSTFGSNKSFFLVTRYDVYFDGALVGSLARTEYKSASARGAYLIVRNTAGNYAAFDSAFRSPAHVPESSAEYSEDYRNKIVYHNGTGAPAFTAGCTLTPAEVETPVFNTNGQLLDLQGNVLGSTKDFSTVYSFRGDYAYVRSSDGLYGIIDKTCRLVIPCELSSNSSSSLAPFASGYELVVKDGKLCWATDADGIVYTSDVPDSVSHRTYGAFARYQDADGQYVYFTPLGKLPTHYKEDNGSGSSTAKILVVENSDKAAGVIGLAGEEIIPLDGTYSRAYDLKASLDGTVVLGNMGYVDNQRTYALYTIAYDADGLSVPEIDDGSWICPTCGARNTGKFCPEDATPRP